MNRYQFMSLDRKNQLRMVKVNGKILHRRLKREYTASLYQLENFYIEVWENGLKDQVLNTINQNRENYEK